MGIPHTHQQTNIRDWDITVGRLHRQGQGLWRYLTRETGIAHVHGISGGGESVELRTVEWGRLDYHWESVANVTRALEHCQLRHLL